MEVLSIPRDRRAAHIVLSETFLRPGQERDFIWRLIDNGETSVAVVRKYWDDVDVPALDTMVRFEVETVPIRKSHGKKRYLYESEDRMSFIIERMFNAGILVNPSTVEMVSRLGLMGDKGFAKPGCFYRGEGKIINIEACEKALRAGIGDVRVYGYGMITLEKM